MALTLTLTLGSPANNTPTEPEGPDLPGPSALFFKSTEVGHEQDWNYPTNWYLNAQATVPAQRVPITGDSITIITHVDIPCSLANSMSAASIKVGHSSSGSGLSYTGSQYVTSPGVEFYNDSRMTQGFCVSAVFYDSSVMLGGTITSATLLDNSKMAAGYVDVLNASVNPGQVAVESGTIGTLYLVGCDMYNGFASNAVITDGGSLVGGTIATATFQNSSQSGGTLYSATFSNGSVFNSGSAGEATFNDSSTLISGDIDVAYFYGSSTLISGDIDVAYFYGMSTMSSGQVNLASFYDSTIMTGGLGSNLDFNNGSVLSSATVYSVILRDSAMIQGGVITDAFLYGTSSITSGNVNSAALYGQSHIDGGEITQAEFRDFSYRGCVSIPTTSYYSGVLDKVWGCTDSNALNYSSSATCDDGSCFYMT